MTRRRWSRAVLAVAAAFPLVVLQPGVAQAAGNAKAYKLMSQTTTADPIARWNPCAGPIDYRVNLTRAPKNSLTEVKQAFTAVAGATGLTFRYAGTTTAIPAAAKGYNATYPAGTEIVIAWVTPGVHSSMLPKTTYTAGMGGYSSWSSYTASGGRAWSIAEGRVVLNATLTARMPRGFGAGAGGTTGRPEAGRQERRLSLQPEPQSLRDTRRSGFCGLKRLAHSLRWPAHPPQPLPTAGFPLQLGRSGARGTPARANRSSTIE
jgi:hypothetical protein